MGQPRVIKRYANRKMYDTSRSCYVTLEEVAEMVRDGHEVQVIDNKSKADLTEVTLTQALLDSERKRRGTVPLVGLRTLIAQGNDFLQKKVAQPVVRARDEAERTVETWRDEAERTVQSWRHEAERVLQHRRTSEGDEAPAAEAPASGESHDNKGKSRRWPIGPSFSPDELQHFLDEVVRGSVVAWLAPHGQSADKMGLEISELRAEIAALRDRVAELESQQPARSKRVNRS
ncbi:MAG: polyhydroxyalkanoate synthesis regulator DNA-binding domain-containing protein [Deltaproteobacteria bacterium]|nr:polyhydroxyalkanoate synthesis regulator DNA-binding domain-containing protein [Deltaproteobacteria bacterium]